MEFSISNLFWLFFILTFIWPMIAKRVHDMRRIQFLRRIEEQRQSRLITLIHRQEALSFFGIQFARFIDIEDSEQILRAIRLTDDNVPIDVVLHTPGGLVLASEQIAYALQRHPAKVTVIVPHYAMSGGTMVALAADEIVMDPNAVLGPVDPQLGDPRTGSYPAASILAAASTPNPNNRDDTLLILADLSRKAVKQVYDVVYRLLSDTMPEEKAQAVADTLSKGRWTHDYPIGIDEAKALGLPINENMPKEFHQLMEFYPQTQQRRPSVEYIPLPYRGRPTETPRGRSFFDNDA